eukprot:CAMPEP_0202110812 /NCGR_PEP_ID=MMETSP0965-20130614/27530_1 /ASSEMBLY_ACC=CAM_ASM_000507 /TAXON_ID=4773 /ORGANISM="Schizochytrium aggregatum, Strain ATCC28209" /LENGTH=190 /DNA_ID=CAMNT_0048680261 /DNA_START=9 /DNA_END=581 /DNA_ORIENTATION=-
MASFVGLRKAGRAHLLMPHQGSIGAGVGLTVAASGAAALGLLPAASPASGAHALLVLLPQQLAFVLSLRLRNELDLLQTAVALGCLIGAVAALHLHQLGELDTDAVLCLVSATLIAGTLIPFLNLRVKILFALWAALLAAPVAMQIPAPPAPLFLTVELLALLTVKLQLFPTSASKLEEKRAARPAKWTW